MAQLIFAFSNERILLPRRVPGTLCFTGLVCRYPEVKESDFPGALLFFISGLTYDEKQR